MESITPKASRKLDAKEMITSWNSELTVILNFSSKCLKFCSFAQIKALYKISMRELVFLVNMKSEVQENI